MYRDIYAVWDFESRNILHAYDKEDEALRLVRENIEAYGVDAVRQWGIIRETADEGDDNEDDAVDADVLMGQALVERALAGSTTTSAG